MNAEGATKAQADATEVNATANSIFIVADRQEGTGYTGQEEMQTGKKDEIVAS